MSLQAQEQRYVQSIKLLIRLVCNAIFVLKWHATVTVCSKINAKLDFPAFIRAYLHQRGKRFLLIDTESERILSVRHKTSVLHQSHAGILKFCVSSSHSALSILYERNSINGYICHSDTAIKTKLILDCGFSLLSLRVIRIT